MDHGKEFFICYENSSEMYESGFIHHGGVENLSHKELKELEGFIISSDNYEGDVCNIVSHIPFSNSTDEDVSYLYRYFINGKGSIHRGDFTYNGGIKSYEDILTLEYITATQLGVESVTVFSFEVLEVDKPLDELVVSHDSEVK